MKQNEGFVLRDRVVPDLLKLAELMGLSGETKPVAATRLLIVIEVGAGRSLRFEVDAIRTRMEAVIKPMQGLLACNCARVTAMGTTILGDGSVLLVLDLKDILP